MSVKQNESTLSHLKTQLNVHLNFSILKQRIKKNNNALALLYLLISIFQ